METMKTSKQYEVVIYNGSVSKTIRGSLIATLISDELRRYGKSAYQLQVVQHPLLPKGTPFEVDNGEWYVIKPHNEQAELEFVYSEWIKPNGITLINDKQIVLSGSFKSGKSPNELHQYFVNENMFGMAITLRRGNDKGEVVAPSTDVQYRIPLATKDPSAMFGLYQGTVSYSMLPALNIDGKSQYLSHDWPESHMDKLETYDWLVFEGLTGNSEKFAIPKELLSGGLIELHNQGLYDFSKMGKEEDVAQIRSILNIAMAEDIVIGTKQ